MPATRSSFPVASARCRLVPRRQGGNLGRAAADFNHKGTAASRRSHSGAIRGGDWRGSGVTFDGVADLAQHALEQRLVVGLDHDADERLGPGRRHEQPAAPVEAEPRGLDASLDRWLLPAAGRRSARQLRSRCGSGVNTRPSALSGRSCVRMTASTCSAGEQAVAGGREVGHDDVAGLLAAEIVAATAHVLDHVAIADLGAMQAQSRLPDGARGRDWTSWSRPRHRRSAGRARCQLCASSASIWSPSISSPRSSARTIAIGVAIERDAEIGAMLEHGGAHRRRRGGAAAGVDVEAVGVASRARSPRRRAPTAAWARRA